MLSGVSLFFRTLNCSHILLHFVGTILTALFYTQVGGPLRARRQRHALPLGTSCMYVSEGIIS